MSSSSTSSGASVFTTTTSSSTASTPKPALHPLESSGIVPGVLPSTSTSSLSSLRHQSSSSIATSSTGGGGGGGERAISPKPMPTPTTLSEWQLLAVLSKANLVQYYDVFIAQGGDDINQIMACEEREFLEIMNLVGMLSKPLHVRRMQRALTEYSQDRTAFNLAAFQQIGPPPPLNYTPPGTDPMALLLPGIAQATSPNFPSLRFLSQLAEKNTTSTPSEVGGETSSTSPLNTTTSSANSVPLAFKFATPLLDTVATDGPSTSTRTPILPIPPPSADGRAATANVYTGNSLGINFTSSSTTPRHLLHPAAVTSTIPLAMSRAAQSSTSSGVGSGIQEKEGSSSPFLAGPVGGGGGGGGPSQPPYGNDFVSLGDFDPNNPSPSENPVLSNAQIARLAECALAASKNLPPLPPRLVQNKKRVSKEVVELLKVTPATPSMIHAFRKYSAIYGRFDTKRKPHKVLTLHETTVNEAAAQLCVLVPSLLTRRDELFPLARQIVKDAGYHYAKSRKRPCDPADLHSPISSPSNSPPPPEHEYDEQPAYKEEEKPIPPVGWAAMIDKMKNEMPE